MAHLLKELLACWVAMFEKVLEGIKALPHEPCERQGTVVLEAGQLAALGQFPAMQVRCSEGEGSPSMGGKLSLLGTVSVPIGRTTCPRGKSTTGSQRFVIILSPLCPLQALLLA